MRSANTIGLGGGGFMEASPARGPVSEAKTAVGGLGRDIVEIVGNLETGEEENVRLEISE